MQYTRLVAKAILFERCNSIQMQNIMIAVNEMNRELTNSQTITAGDAEKKIAA
jgi:hypothetical protein